MMTGHMTRVLHRHRPSAHAATSAHRRRAPPGRRPTPWKRSIVSVTRMWRLVRQVQARGQEAGGHDTPGRQVVDSLDPDARPAPAEPGPPRRALHGHRLTPHRLHLSCHRRRFTHRNSRYLRHGRRSALLSSHARVSTLDAPTPPRRARRTRCHRQASPGRCAPSVRQRHHRDVRPPNGIRLAAQTPRSDPVEQSGSTKNQPIALHTTKLEALFRS